jgi:hypothetical protein
LTLFLGYINLSVTNAPFPKGVFAAKISLQSSGQLFTLYAFINDGKSLHQETGQVFIILLALIFSKKKTSLVAQLKTMLLIEKLHFVCH